MNETDTKNIKKKTGIIAVLAMLIVIAIIASALVIAKPYANKKPKFVDNPYGNYRTIEYLDRKYTYCTDCLNLFEFELDKKIGQERTIFPISFYTLKNDPNKNFIYVSEWQNSRIYSCLSMDSHSFSDPDEISAIELTVDDEIVLMTDEDCINDFLTIQNFHSTKKVRYNPDECIIIKSRPKIKGNYPIEYTYKGDAFIYNGEQWLVMEELDTANDGYSTIIHYGHPIDNSEICVAFEHIAEKYFAEVYYESIDYEVGTVDPDEEYIIDPDMVTLAD